MILKDIQFVDFRCFESLRIQFDPHLNVFVGGNGAGKTAILQGIAQSLVPLLKSFPIKKRGLIRDFAKSDIRITGEDQSAPFAIIRASARTNGSSVNWERTKWRDSLIAPRALPTDTSQLKTYAGSVTSAHDAKQPYVLPVFAIYGTDRARDPEKAFSQLRVPQNYFGRLAGLERALTPKMSFRESLEWFNYLEQLEFRDLRDDKISGTLPELDAVRQAISSMIPEIHNPRIDGKSGRFAVDADSQVGTKFPLALEQLSDGYQAMLGLVMDFALRLALANPPQQTGNDPLASQAILIIDEIDLHLHPSWQQRVIPDLRRTFPNTQLILTTHSPQVATTVPSASLRILKGTKLFSAPAGTEGAEAERMLEDVFQVQPRPDLPPAQKLGRYLSLVDERKWASDEALQLRTELDQWSQGEEPMLLEADLRIDNMKWEAGQ